MSVFGELGVMYKSKDCTCGDLRPGGIWLLNAGLTKADQASYDRSATAVYVQLRDESPYGDDERFGQREIGSSVSSSVIRSVAPNRLP